MLRKHLERMQPSHGPEASCSDTQDRVTETGNQHLRHVTHIWDQSLRAQQYIILRRSHGQVTKGPGLTPDITTEYSADSRDRTPMASVCLHIQKPKPQATIKNEIEKIHKLIDVTIQYTNDDGGRAFAMAMLPPPPTKPITLPWQRGFSMGGIKRRVHLATWRWVSYGKIGLTTVAVMPLVL